MKNLSDLFVFISSVCLLRVSLLCSALSFFPHSLSPPLFSPLFPCLLLWPCISVLHGQRIQRLTNDQLGDAS